MKEFDVVLFGATGFTGELVAEYLAQFNDSTEALKWAIAGRNLKKLEQVRERLSQVNAAWGDLTLIEANSNDPESLRGMASRAKVVCSTVGPYAKYGSPVVAACVSEGAHYCDLTGETQWIRAMIDAHHEAAQTKGVKIVHCCGFDSIPSDLGTYVLQQEAQARFDKPCEQANFYVVKIKGGFSGGTVASLVNVLEEATGSPAVRKVLMDPYGLNPKGHKPSIKQRDQMTAKWASDIGRWTGPFVMAGINTRVVRRSNALMGDAYGRDFRYSESTSTGRGLKGRVAANALALGSTAFTGALTVSPLRKVLVKRVLPAAGDGPNKQAREDGFFKIKIVGHVDGKPALQALVEGDKDPGYGYTALMLAQSAMCLAKDELPEVGGVLTPASSMGDALVARLRNAGMTLSVTSI